MDKITQTLDYKAVWQKEAGIFRQIYQLGIEKYFNFYVPNIYWAFNTNSNSVACMDEGINDGKLRVGGSGIFEFNDQAQLINLLLSTNIDIITTHSDCGGARLAYADNFNIAVEAVSDKELEDYTVNWGKRLTATLSEAYKVQNKYKQIFYQHITCDQLGRPKGFHLARMLYYNATRHPFNPGRVIGLPRGYSISRYYLTSQQAQNFSSRCLALSFSKQGFDAWSTKYNPFVMIAIFDPLDKQFSLEMLTDEIKAITKPYSDRIIVGGFVSGWVGF